MSSNKYMLYKSSIIKIYPKDTYNMKISDYNNLINKFMEDYCEKFLNEFIGIYNNSPKSDNGNSIIDILNFSGFIGTEKYVDKHGINILENPIKVTKIEFLDDKYVVVFEVAKIKKIK